MDMHWDYRKIARKVAELRHLDMTFAAIAKSLNVSKQLVLKAFCYYREENPRGSILLTNNGHPGS